ncbi:MAG: DUF4136 domain-containing protein [Longimicrobiales bacterium]
MRRPLIFALVLAMGGCATTNLSTDYNPNADFSAYNTFAWLEDPGTVDDARLTGDLVSRRIQLAIETAMIERGFNKVDAPEDASVAVGYHASLSDRVDVTTMQTYNGYWGRHGWGYPGYWGTSHTTTNEYTEGTLIVDVFDTSTRELAWRGVAEGRVRDAAEPTERQERLTDILRDLLSDFPPGR